MRKESFDQKFDRLRNIAGGSITDEAVETLRDAINGSNIVLAALAVQIAGQRHVSVLIPDMVKAFDRYMVDPDKGCQVKTAVVDALHRLEYANDDIYLIGINHVQMEPAFGGPADTAADMRAGCAVALASMRHPDAERNLVNLLVDPHSNPRRAAVKGLAHLGTDAAELVLRLKALVGDREPDVLGECFTGLISISPDSSVKFVGQFLQSSNTAIVDQAALALGQSHTGEAFDMLREAWEDNLDPGYRRMLLLPISLLRRDDAFEFLLEVIKTSGSKLAAEAVTAMGVYADDRSISRIREAVKKKNDPQVVEAFTREFGEKI